jgi:hypothetical protein
MRSFWSDPYLWIHLSGLAALPLFLEGCLIGFAMGAPFLPVWLELSLVVAAGIAPVLWMQWQRPFYIFSIVAVSVKPEALTDDQRRLLSLFKLPRNRLLAVFVTVALIVALQKIYDIAPIAATSVSFLSASHGLGLLLAAVSFFACNLFSQVPLSVASVMLSSESAFNTVAPYPLEQVRQSFTIVGLQLKQILPPVVPEAQPALAARQSTTEGAIESSQKVGHTAVGNAAADSTKPFTDDLWSDKTEPEIDPTEVDAPSEKAVGKKVEAVKEAEAPLTESELELESDR